MLEQFLTQSLGPGDIRCRITAAGVRVEVPVELQLKNTALWWQTHRELEQRIEADGRILAEVSDYSRGSAFLHPVSSK